MPRIRTKEQEVIELIDKYLHDSGIEKTWIQATEVLRTQNCSKSINPRQIVTTLKKIQKTPYPYHPPFEILNHQTRYNSSTKTTFNEFLVVRGAA